MPPSSIKAAENTIEKGSWGNVFYQYSKASERVTVYNYDGGGAGAAQDAPWKIHPEMKPQFFRMGDGSASAYLTDMEYLFSDLTFSAIEYRLHLEKVVSMKGAFKGATILKNIVLGKGEFFNSNSVTDLSEMYMNAVVPSQATGILPFPTSDTVTNMSHMFDGLSYANQETIQLDLTMLNMTTVTEKTDMFANTKISELTLGDKVRLDETVGLPSPEGNEALVWQKADGSSQQYTAAELMANYGTGDATPGTYIGVEPKENLEAIEAKDLLLYVGDDWTGADNFVSAKDQDGNDLTYTPEMVSGTVDTTKPGENIIIYCNGKAKVTIVVEVIDPQKEINVTLPLAMLFSTNSGQLEEANVQSEKYQISNNSTNYGVEVTLAAYAVEDADGVTLLGANDSNPTKVENSLRLNLLINDNKEIESLSTDMPDHLMGAIRPQQKMALQLQGEYFGALMPDVAAKHPIHAMGLKFKLMH